MTTAITAVNPSTANGDCGDGTGIEAHSKSFTLMTDRLIWPVHLLCQWPDLVITKIL